MTTRLHLSCGGCDAEAHSEPIRVFHGNPVNLEAVAPAGWIVSDPWTRCTYCPTCWKEIANSAVTQEDIDAATAEAKAIAAEMPRE